MNTSLRPSFNAALILLLSIGLFVICALAPSIPLLWMAIGISTGVVTGILQYLCLERHPFEFRQAQTALAIRSVFIAHPEGRLAIRVQWGGAIVLLVTALIRSSQPVDAALSALAGYMALMLCRETITFMALVRLSKLTNGNS